MKVAFDRINVVEKRNGNGGDGQFRSVIEIQKTWIGLFLILDLNGKLEPTNPVFIAITLDQKNGIPPCHCEKAARMFLKLHPSSQHNHGGGYIRKENGVLFLQSGVNGYKPYSGTIVDKYLKEELMAKFHVREIVHEERVLRLRALQRVRSPHF